MIISRFSQRRTILLPTRWGRAGLVLLPGGLFVLGLFECERLLYRTERSPAKVLIVGG